MSFSLINVHAQKKFSDHKFSKKDKFSGAKIPDQFQNEDAVIINYLEHYHVSNEYSSSFITVYRIKQRTRLLTDRGVERYGRIYAPKRNGFKLINADARTYKKNGEVLDLKAKEIKEIDYLSEDEVGFSKENYYIFAIPGVEVGDEVEIVYTYRANTTWYGNEFYFSTNLPVLDYQLNLQFSNDMSVAIQLYNGLGQPSIRKDVSSVFYTWKRKNVAYYGDKNYSIEALEVPYASYSLKTVGTGYSDNTATGNTWTSYVNRIMNDIVTDPGKSKNASVQFLNNDCSDALKVSNRLDKMTLIHNYINDKFELTRFDREPSYFVQLETHQITRPNLFRLYNDILNYLGIPHYITLARNKYSGPIDTKFVAYHQIEDELLSFRDDENVLHFIIPKTYGNEYQIDEIPSSIQNSTVLLIDAENWNKVKQLKFKKSTINENELNRQVQANVNTVDGYIAHQVKEIATGAFSTQRRDYFLSLYEESNDEELTELLLDRIDGSSNVDSVNVEFKSKESPFPFVLSYEIVLNDRVQDLGDGLISINLNDWFYHNKLSSYDLTRTLDFYAPFRRMDRINYFIRFDKHVELINADVLNVALKESHCRYALNAEQINPNTIKIESSYVINSLQIPKEEIGQLRKVNDQLKKSNSNQLIVKINK